MAGANGGAESIALVGAGRVGGSFAIALHKAGLRVTGIVDQDLAKARRCATLSAASIASSSVAALTSPTDFVLLAVPDDALPEVVTPLSSCSAIRPGTVVAHTSGVLDSAVLAPLRTIGGLVASAHPVMTFAGREEDWQLWNGAYVTLEGDVEARQRLAPLFCRVGAVPVEFPGPKNVLYHLACVFASNYVVALQASAMRLLAALGFDEATAARTLAPLLAQTAANLVAQGPVRALTGPIARGDLGTVEKHLRALTGLPDLAAAYAALGRVCVGLARQQDKSKEPLHQAIDALLAASLSPPRRENPGGDK
ncbi:MAG: DUF2520 domain-containing protein [bacterium]|jgi:predicted short-subunit dehydrogenase-like oxidoreductase (DUF2520 family)|nr:DUF2520 domain-containing protein [candidate division KSB1 bacterium]MDH7560259.1 DUF2520 domain-containing protein [bacterium]